MAAASAGGVGSAAVETGVALCVALFPSWLRGERGEGARLADPSSIALSSAGARSPWHSSSRDALLRSLGQTQREAALGWLTMRRSEAEATSQTDAESVKAALESLRSDHLPERHRQQGLLMQFFRTCCQMWTLKLQTLVVRVALPGTLPMPSLLQTPRRRGFEGLFSKMRVDRNCEPEAEV